MLKDSNKVSSKKLLDKYHKEHIQKGVEAARRGEFATDTEVKAFFDKYGEPSLSTVDALIEGEGSGRSKKKIKDIVAAAKKKLKNG